MRQRRAAQNPTTRLIKRGSVVAVELHVLMYVYACSVYTTLRACTQCRSHNRFSRREALLCESFNQSNIQWTMISVNRATTVVLVT